MIDPTSNRQERTSVPKFSAAINSRATTNTDLHQNVNSGYSEWSSSLAPQSLIDLNVISFGPGEAWDWLIYSDKIPRRNDGRVTDSILKRYRHIDESGGWLVQNVDPITGEDRLYVRVKFDLPRLDKDGKVIKYETPPNEPTEPYFPKVPHDVWKIVSEAHDIPFHFPYRDFWAWLKAHSIPIWVTEGEKKAGCLFGQGKVSISVPGVHNFHDTTLKKAENVIDLHPFLKHFADGRDWFITYDQDKKPKTKANVKKAVDRLGKLLILNGCKVNVVKWDGKLGKGIDDYIANENRVEDCQIIPFEQYSAKFEIEKLKALTYPIDLTINSRYIGNIPFPKARIIGLKAPKGTGKTWTVAQWVKPWIEQGNRLLVLGHRRQLLEELCGRLGIRYRDEMIANLDHKKEAQLFGYGLCFDSLKEASIVPFYVDDWIDSDVPYIIFVDECEQSIWHLLAAKTDIKKDRVEVMINFNRLLESAAHVIYSDADLSDVTIDYACRVANTKDTWILENTYKGDINYNCYLYQENAPDALLTDLLDSVHEGKHFIITQAQKHKSPYSTINLERYLKSLFSHLKILRIDAESIADPTHPAFCCITRLNEIIPNYDVIIASPSIETGISIDKEHRFSCVWAFGQGVLPSDSVRQTLSRVRHNCDRRVWLPKKGLGRIGNGGLTPQSLMMTEKQLFSAHCKFLNQCHWDEEVEAFSGIALTTWSKMACRVNYSKRFYREQIASDLEAEGNTIIWVEKTPHQDLRPIKKRVVTNKDESYNGKLNKMEFVPSPTPEQLEALQQKQGRDETERLQLEKGLLEKKYKVPVKADLARMDDKGLYPKLRFFYYLTIGRKHLPERDKKVASSMVKNKMAWLPDFNSNLFGVSVQTYDFLGLTELITAVNKEYCKDSPELIAIVTLALQYKRDLKKLGITVSENLSVMQNINNLLAKSALKLPLLRQIRDGKNRIRIYGSPVSTFNDEMANSICQAWLVHDDSKSGDIELEDLVS